MDSQEIKNPKGERNLGELLDLQGHPPQKTAGHSDAQSEGQHEQGPPDLAQAPK